MNTEVVTYLEAIGIANDSTVYNVGTSREVTGQYLYTIHDKLWNDLDDAGVLSKIKFMHLLYWSDANKNKLNFLNPVDSDTAFRLEFFGGWTFDEEGSQPNGTNGYANTHYNPNSELSGTDSRNEHYGIYSLTDNTPQGDTVCDLGAYSGSSSRSKVGINRGQSKNNFEFRKSSIVSVNRPVYDDAIGHFLGTIRPSGNTNQRLVTFKNGVKLGNANSTGDRPNLKLFFGAENYLNGTAFANTYSNQKYLLIHGGEGLTDQESEDLSVAIAEFYEALGSSSVPKGYGQIIMVLN